MTLSTAIRQFRNELVAGSEPDVSYERDVLRLILGMWELEAVNMEHRIFLATRREHVPLDGLLLDYPSGAGGKTDA